MTMNLNTTAGALHSALKTVKPTIQRFNTIPVLPHVLIKGDTMTATDLDMEIRTKIPSSSASGAICLDHRVLSTITGNLPSDTAIAINSGKGGGASLTFEGGFYTLNTLPASDFPDLINKPIRKTFKVPASFLDKLRFVSHFISTEETRYYLNGVCISDGVLVATDGHRLGFVDTVVAPEDRPIIPRGAVRAIVDHLGAPSQVSFGEGVAVFDFPGTVLRTKLIDGTFPDYRRVIPAIADGMPTVAIEAAPLTAAIKRSFAISGFSKGVAITLATSKSGHLAVARDRPDIGTSREVIRATVTGAPIVIALDGRYLQNIVRAHRGSGTVTLRMTDAGSPIRVTSEREGYHTVLMPMRGGSDRVAREALDLLAPVKVMEAAE